MATYAIGDVQGCFGSLMALLERLRFDADRDRLWFTGDLVNRGPRSLETLRFVRGLGDRAVTVLGNHDLHLLGVACGVRRLKAGDTLSDVLEAPDRDDLMDWLRRRPLLHRDTERGVVMVHAGLPPQWTLDAAQACASAVEAKLRGGGIEKLMGKLSGDQCDTWSASLPHAGQLGYIVNCLTRLRYCDAAGRLELREKGPPGSQPAPYLPWFAVPGRLHASETIVFGHWASLGACNEPGVHARVSAYRAYEDYPWSHENKAVTPAKAGVRVFPGFVDSRFRGNDTDNAICAYPGAVGPAVSPSPAPIYNEWPSCDADASGRWGQM